jgi:hypothetical protein
VAPKTKQDYVDEVVAGTANAYGALTGNAADDKTLIDWNGRPLREPRATVTESVQFGLEEVPVDAASVELANEPIDDLDPLRRLTVLRD